MNLATLLIEQNPDGVVGFDREYRYTLWNATMERISGMRRDQVLGRPALEVFPFLHEIGEDRCFAAALAGETAVSRGRSYRIPETGRVGFFDAHYIPLRDEQGVVIGGVGLIRDVTERHEAEARARESRELFERYMAFIPGVAFVKDSEGRHVFANRLFEQTHGLAPGAWLGKLDEDIFPPDTARRFRQHDLEVIAGGEAVRMVDLQGARHEPEHWMWVKFPLTDASGQQLVAGLAFNITEQYQAEQALRASEERFRQLFAELEEANRRKDEFLATLGHELRNPLAPLITAAELLRARSSDDPIIQQTIEVIGRQVKQMRRLIDDLLDVARITRGIVSLRLERIDLREVLRESVRAAQSWLEVREHELTLVTAPEPVWVDADRVRIEQVLTNLLSNAAKFTPPRGRVSVSVEREAGAAVLRVRDTGKGIPGEMLPHIFELFTQVNPSLDRAEGGLGLGLTLVKRLVEMHGGTVSVTSEGEGRGTEFVVQLPAQEGPAEHEPAATDRDAAPALPPASGRRVLIVDDNLDSAEMLNLLLPGWGYETAMAHTGPQAIERVRKFRPDVILLDIGLPGMSGYEVAAQLRTDDRCPALVALTGYGQDQDRQRSHDSGFAAHLTKPVELDTLRALLASLCQPRAG